MTTGSIFDIQHFSLHDGPGIRTTVFFKGCPLKCLWCHNPESQQLQPQLLFTPDLCIGDAACLDACPRHAHVLSEDGAHTIDRDRCLACGQCAQNCYAEALELSGRTVTVDDIMRDIESDIPYYETSGGGLTLSGGEPLLQPQFARALLAAAKARHIDTAIETSGFASWNTIEPLLPLLDHIMFDVKETDDQRHLRVTGVPFTPIRQNLLQLDRLGVPVLLRLPLVPNINDSDDHLRQVAQLMQQLDHALGCEIMPYHPLGESKRLKLGLEQNNFLVPTAEQKERWLATLTAHGANVINA